MKFLVVLPSLIFLLSVASTCKAGNGGEVYEVALWKGFAEAAITYTFDDNCSNQYSIAIPVMNEFDFEGTFYPVINWGPNWNIFKNAVAEGHEVGSHTVSHPNLSGLSVTDQEAELKNSKDEIDNRVSGQQCLTIAYPYCVPGNATLCKKYFIAARHCQGNIEKSTPTDFLNISSIICGDQGAVSSTQQFNNKAETAAKSHGWCVYLIHGIDSDGGYSPVSSQVFRESLEYLDENRERFWVSTFSNVVRYIRERNCVSVTETARSENTIEVLVTDSLDNAVYNIPVSVRCKLPDGWEAVQVNQSGYEVYSRISEIGSEKYIEFDVVPDSGSLVISRQSGTGFSTGMIFEKPSFRFDQNPFTNHIVIESEGEFEFWVQNINGEVVESGRSFGNKTIGSFLLPGIYMLTLRNTERTENYKIAKKQL